MKKKFSEQAAELDLLLANLFAKWPSLHPDYLDPDSFEAHWREVNETMQALAPMFKQAAAVIRELWVNVKRLDLFMRLLTWHFPARLARIIADRCPERLLPDVDIAERWAE